MKRASLIVLTVSALSAAPGTEVPVFRSGPFLILHEVYVNGGGPFRMLIDTGNASSLIRPSIAGKIGFRASAWMEQVTAAGVRRLPAGFLDEVRVGNVPDKNVEVMVGDVHLSGVDGVLGQSWLARHDYLLDYRGRRIVLDGEAPEGIRADLRSAEGRPSVWVEVNGRGQDVVIDSGAELVVLFESAGGASRARLMTNFSSVASEAGYVTVAIGDAWHKRMSAARVNPGNPAAGSLPAGAFAGVYVSNRNGQVVLVP